MNKTNKDTDWRIFLKQCLQFKNQEELEIFFDVVLTLSDKEEIVRRYLIIKELLNANKTQREIAAHLKVSIFNVSRGSNAIKTCKYNLKKLLNL